MIAFNTARPVKDVSRTITVQTDDPAQPRSVITIKGQVQNPFESKPEDKISFGRLTANAGQTKEIELVNVTGKPMRPKLRPPAADSAFDINWVVMMMFATLGILVYGLTLTRFMIRVLQVPQTIIVPIILVLCAVGTYALAGRLFDVWVMVAFGLIGFVLRTYGYPMAPLVLGIVLGDLLEKNLRRGLVLSDGDLTPFVTRPISAVLFVAILLIVAFRFEFVRRSARRLIGRGASEPAA